MICSGERPWRTPSMTLMILLRSRLARHNSAGMAPSAGVLEKCSSLRGAVQSARFGYFGGIRRVCRAGAVYLSRRPALAAQKFVQPPGIGQCVHVFAESTPYTGIRSFFRSSGVSWG